MAPDRAQADQLLGEPVRRGLGEPAFPAQIAQAQAAIRAAQGIQNRKGALEDRTARARRCPRGIHQTPGHRVRLCHRYPYSTTARSASLHFFVREKTVFDEAANARE